MREKRGGWFAALGALQGCTASVGARARSLVGGSPSSSTWRAVTAFCDGMYQPDDGTSRHTRVPSPGSHTWSPRSFWSARCWERKEVLSVQPQTRDTLTRALFRIWCHLSSRKSTLCVVRRPHLLLQDRKSLCYFHFMGDTGGRQ